jgi:predicted nucleotidyltransferase
MRPGFHGNGRDRRRPARCFAKTGRGVGHTIAQPRIPINREKITAFCRKWKLREFALFGSVLRDDFRLDSDVDVLVALGPDHGLSLFDWVDMIEELKELFGRNVDLVEKETLRNPFRRHSILTNRQVIYAA